MAVELQEETHPSELLEFNPGKKPQQAKADLREWCLLAWEQGTNAIQEFESIREKERYIKYLMGEQWASGRPTYKASPVNNRLFRQMEEIVAILTDLRQTFETTTHNELYSEQAEVITKTAKAWWVNQDVDVALAFAVMYAYLGLGYLRLNWNGALFNGLGDFYAEAVGAESVMPIGPAHFDLQRWEGLIYEEVKPISFFRRRWPLAPVKPSGELSSWNTPSVKPKYMTEHTFRNLSPQMQRRVGRGMQTRVGVIPCAKYREFWVRDWSVNLTDRPLQMGDERANWSYQVAPGKPLYPRGRLIVTGGENFTVVYDGPNPWWHGRWGFVPVRIKPVPWRFDGVSELKTKIPMQDVVNHILAGVLDLIKKAINPPLIFPNNAFSDSVRRVMDPSMPNAKIGYSPFTPRPPEYAKPPELPGFVYNTLTYAQNEMDDDSGLLDFRNIARKKEVPAGDTLENLKQSEQTIMRLKGRWLESSVREVGEQMIPNFFQYYSLPRRITLLGTKGITWSDVFDWNPGTMVPSGVHPEAHWRQFVFNVTNGSLLNANREKNAALAIQLRRSVNSVGVPDMDRRTLYELLDMEEIYEKVKRGLSEEIEEANALVQEQEVGQNLQGLLAKMSKNA